MKLFLGKTTNLYDWKSTYAGKGILADFPFLWAIHHEWGPDNIGLVKVSQAMSDLKAFVALKPSETKADLWSFITCSGENPDSTGYMTKLPRQERMWAAVILKELDRFSLTWGGTLRHLILVEYRPELSHVPSRVTIFRHPEKLWLNDVVKEVAELHATR